MTGGMTPFVGGCERLGLEERRVHHFDGSSRACSLITYLCLPGLWDDRYLWVKSVSQRTETNSATVPTPFRG